MDNQALAVRRSDAISRGVGVTTSVYAERAENAEIWDVEGRRYIDFAAGIAVVNTGHRHPKVMAAVRDQLDTLPIPAIRSFLTRTIFAWLSVSMMRSRATFPRRRSS